MAVTPTRILEIEFDAGVWTNVTADFVELSTRRGRNRELGAFETGTLQFTLRNAGRKYDPDNAAGPYYGKLRPNRRVRLRATYNAVTYPVFVGYIDRISQVSGGPNHADATFEVSDFFKLLNRADLPSSVYVAEIETDSPTWWWRLGEPSGTTTVVDSVGGRTADVVGNATFGEPGLVVRDPDSAMTVGLPIGGILRTDDVVLTGTAPWTIEFWIRPTTLSTADVTVALDIVGTDGNSAVRMGIDNTHTGTDGPWVAIIDRTGAPWEKFVASATAVDTDHHVAATYDGTNVRLYHNGAAVGTALAFSGTFTTRHLAFGGPAFGSGEPVVGTLDELAIYGTALSAGRIAAHNAAGRTPWNGDTPGARLGRIFDLAAVPALDRNIDAGTTALQATDLGGDALGYAQKVEETELGWLFVARDGKLRFIGRQAGFTGAYLTSLGTLVDDDSGAGLPYRSGDSDVDESIIVTRSTASREGSVAVTVYDAAAKAEFGWLDATHDGLLHADDTYSRSYAEWILNTHKAPASRVGTVSLELTKDPAALYPAILALEIGDRVVYKRKPQNTGAVTTIDMRVEAISHETGGHYWRTQLQLSPFNLVAGLPMFIWDTTRWDQHVWGI